MVYWINVDDGDRRNIVDNALRGYIWLTIEYKTQSRISQF